MNTSLFSSTPTTAQQANAPPAGQASLPLSIFRSSYPRTSLSGSVTATVQPKPSTSTPVTVQKRSVAEQKPELSFAHHFNSPSFTIHLGQDGRTSSTFHLPRQLLIMRSVYFLKLLSGSFQGIEATDNAVTLDTEVDRVDAFKMFVDWLFLGDYTPPNAAIFLDQNFVMQPTSILHAWVYVLAERLCAEGLKVLAVKKMSMQLQEEYDRFGGTRMHPSAMAKLVKAVYPYTRDVFPDDDGTVQEGAAAARDPMRHLIARYIGSVLCPTLRSDAEFSRLMRGCQGCGEFPYDLLDGVVKGARLVPS